jgi:hypothetical protein
MKGKRKGEGWRAGLRDVLEDTHACYCKRLYRCLNCRLLAVPLTSSISLKQMNKGKNERKI